MKMLTQAAFAALSIGLTAGCSGTVPAPPTPAAPPTTPTPTQPTDPTGGHGHGSGPHEGTLADWGGGKYHVEFTVDHDKQEATVYILGDDEKSPAPIAAAEIQLSITDPAMQVTLKAAPQEGDPEGSASRFVGNHESLGVVQEYAGTITGVVEDTPYSGDFKEEPHGAH
jgi:hypothetical protein